MAAKRDFINTADWTREAIEALLDTALALKRGAGRESILDGRSMAMVFFNPSLRTRTSFELAMQQLGGHAVNLEVGAGMWRLEVEDGVPMLGDAAEHVKDAARVLGRYADVIGVRAFPPTAAWSEVRRDRIVGGFAEHAPVPVINMESSLYHPCQALADALTVKELLGGTQGVRFAVTWAHHPKPLPTAVPNSAVLVAAQLGMQVTLAHPQGYALDGQILAQARALAAAQGGSLRVTHDRKEATDGAQVVYAKSWGSLDHIQSPDSEALLRREHADWIIDDDAMARSDRGFFMHCLPVRRNVVASDSVLDGPRSAVYGQAENRLHAQKALLLKLLGA